MPKTPDEVKKGLECCAASYADCHKECPYKLDCDGSQILKDSLALLQKLQDEKGELLKNVEQLQAELADTRKAVSMTNGLCDICKHQNAHENECEANDFLCFKCPADCACKECYSDAGHYEWRGVQKEETP